MNLATVELGPVRQYLIQRTVKYCSSKCAYDCTIQHIIVLIILLPSDNHHSLDAVPRKSRRYPSSRCLNCVFISQIFLASRNAKIISVQVLLQQQINN